MTLPAQAQIQDEPTAPSVEGLLGEELKGLRDEIEALMAKGMSEQEAQGLLDWASEIEKKVRAVASVLVRPSPEAVASYLRLVASGVSEARSRRFASSSLRLLQAALSRLS